LLIAYQKVASFIRTNVISVDLQGPDFASFLQCPHCSAAAAHFPADDSAFDDELDPDFNIDDVPKIDLEEDDFGSDWETDSEVNGKESQAKLTVAELMVEDLLEELQFLRSEPRDPDAAKPQQPKKHRVPSDVPQQASRRPPRVRDEHPE
jgi:hypothetical protein